MKRCTKCGEFKPESGEYFNLLPSGTYRGTCKKCMAVNTKKHYVNNPQKVMDRVSKYKKQKELAGGYCSEVDAAALRMAQGDQCAYCALPLHGEGELDHKTPVSRGGNSSPSNMAWACTTCNRDKYNKTPQEFFQWRKQCGL